MATADTNEEPLIEMDRGPRKIVEEKSAPVVLDLDLVDSAQRGNTRCVDCQALAPVNDQGRCRACYEDSAPARANAAASSDFGAIAQQSAANANGVNLDAMARGRATMGVGFTSAEGYIEALRRGVLLSTLREYVDTLRGTYKLDVKLQVKGSSYEITISNAGNASSFTANFLEAGTGVSKLSKAEQAANAAANMAAGKAMKAAAAEKKKKAQAAALKAGAVAQAKGEQKTGGIVVIADEQQATKVPLIHGKLVAGSLAEGHGIIIGWTGAGDMTRAEMMTRLAAAQCSGDWAEKSKEPGVQLTRAVHEVAGSDFNCEQEKKKDQQVAEAREWSTRWMLVTRAVEGAAATASRVGQKYGDIVLCVTLYEDKPEPELVFDEGADAALVEKIRAAFALRIGEQRYNASDVSKWLKDTIRKHCAAVRYGNNFYVPRLHRATVERLVAAFKTWGDNWMDPPLPVATCEQLGRGIANGLKRDVDDVLSKLEAQRRERRKKDPNAEVGETAALSFTTLLRGVLADIAAYTPLLGDENVADARDKVRAAMLELSNALDETTLAMNARFDNIWEEIKLDIANGKIEAQS